MAGPESDPGQDRGSDGPVVGPPTEESNEITPVEVPHRRSLGVRALRPCAVEAQLRADRILRRVSSGHMKAVRPLPEDPPKE